MDEKIVWSLISRPHQNPAYHVLHCFQKRVLIFDKIRAQCTHKVEYSKLKVWSVSDSVV